MRQEAILPAARNILLLLLMTALPAISFTVSAAAGSRDNGVTDLIKAIRDGQNKKAEKLIERKKFINDPDKFGWTPLMYAVFQEDHELVKQLLSQGADPNLRDRDGITPLIASIMRMTQIFMFQYYPERRALLQIAHTLIESGADPNLADNEGNTPLIYAVIRDQETVVAALIYRGASSNLADRYGRTPLFFMNNRDTVKNWAPTDGMLTYQFRLSRTPADESKWDPAYAKKVAEARTQAEEMLKQVRARITQLLNEVGGTAPDPANVQIHESPIVDSSPQHIVGSHDNLMNILNTYYRSSRRDGKYNILAHITPEGTVDEAVVLTGIPDGVSENLQKAALKVRFQPAMKDGRPVAFWFPLIGFVKGDIFINTPNTPVFPPLNLPHSIP